MSPKLDAGLCGPNIEVAVTEVVSGQRELLQRAVHSSSQHSLGEDRFDNLLR